MKRLLITVVAVLSCSVYGFAQTKAPLEEPKCCAGKQCKHATGEDKHHVCTPSCHDSHQKKGSCCAPHKHAAQAQPKLAEPKCCAKKTCHHATGEATHHVCTAACHDSHQKKGSCCQPHSHKKK